MTQASCVPTADPALGGEKLVHGERGVGTYDARVPAAETSAIGSPSSLIGSRVPRSDCRGESVHRCVKWAGPTVPLLLDL